MLTVGRTTNSGESIAMYYALESLTLGCTNNVHEGNVLFDDVLERDDVAEFDFPLEIGLEFNELFLGSGSCLFEVPLKRRAGVLFCRFVIGKLYSGITIFFYCTDLRNNARTSLDNGAWYILTIGTENGSHSDFLSN